mmetsp:Transcript_95232/g.291253  ORF Transcript_95232/g.291253 Transcript_95232/m.291253 type:complete len:282 (+) Transcript_95232:609-1454(+)
MVHPDGGCPQLVPGDLLPWDFVHLAVPIRRRPEDVTHVRARDVLDGAAAHPSPEANLHLLAAVQVHVRVVPAEPEEHLAVGSQEAARHDGRARGPGAVWAVVREGRLLPERPRKAQDAEAAPCLVMKIVRTDAVDAGNDNRLSLSLLYPRQHRLQVPRRRLDVAVQEHGHLGRGPPDALHPRDHEAPPLLQPQHRNLRQRHQVIGQLVLQPRPMLFVKAVGHRHAGIVDNDDLAQQVGRRVVEHRMYGADEDGKVLVVENDDDAGCGQVRRILLRQPPARL